MKFTPEDFSGMHSGEWPALMDIKGVVCAIANARLQAWLDAAPEVWKHDDGKSHTINWSNWREWGWNEVIRGITPTHKARLVNIEEIK